MNACVIESSKKKICNGSQATHTESLWSLTLNARFAPEPCNSFLCFLPFSQILLKHDKRHSPFSSQHMLTGPISAFIDQPTPIALSSLPAAVHPAHWISRPRNRENQNQLRDAQRSPNGCAPFRSRESVFFTSESVRRVRIRDDSTAASRPVVTITQPESPDS